jgi:hypothetical protein
MGENPDREHEEVPGRPPHRRTCERRRKRAGSNGPKREGETQPRG